MSVGAILVPLTILAMIAALPTWRYSHGWGLLPSACLGFALVVVVIVFVAGP